MLTCNFLLHMNLLRLMKHLNGIKQYFQQFLSLLHLVILFTKYLHVLQKLFHVLQTVT